MKGFINYFKNLFPNNTSNNKTVNSDSHNQSSYLSLLLAENYIRRSDFSKAISIYDKLYSNKDKMDKQQLITLLSSYGFALESNKQFLEAIKLYNECLFISPYEINLYFSRSVCYEFSHQYDLAINDLNRAEELYSTYKQIEEIETELKELIENNIQDNKGIDNVISQIQVRRIMLKFKTGEFKY